MSIGASETEIVCARKLNWNERETIIALLFSSENHEKNVICFVAFIIWWKNTGQLNQPAEIKLFCTGQLNTSLLKHVHPELQHFGTWKKSTENVRNNIYSNFWTKKGLKNFANVVYGVWFKNDNVRHPIFYIHHFRMRIILGTTPVRFLVSTSCIPGSYRNISLLNRNLWIQKKLVQFWNCTYYFTLSSTEHNESFLVTLPSISSETCVKFSSFKKYIKMPLWAQIFVLWGFTASKYSPNLFVFFAIQFWGSYIPPAWKTAHLIWRVSVIESSWVCRNERLAVEMAIFELITLGMVAEEVIFIHIFATICLAESQM